MRFDTHDLPLRKMHNTVIGVLFNLFPADGLLCEIAPCITTASSNSSNSSTSNGTTLLKSLEFRIAVSKHIHEILMDPNVVGMKKILLKRPNASSSSSAATDTTTSDDGDGGDSSLHSGKNKISLASWSPFGISFVFASQSNFANTKNC